MSFQFNEAPKSGLPDLDEFFKKLTPGFKKKNQDPFEPKKTNWSWWILISLVLVCVLALFSSIVTVNPGESLIITRFGAYYKTEGAGRHWLVPFADKRILINLNQTESVSYQGETVTEDGNLVNVNVSMAYQIQDPKKYLFGGNVQGALLAALSQASTAALLQNSFIDLLSSDNWKGVGLQINQNVGDLSKFGVKITGVEIQNIQVPNALSESFNKTISSAEAVVKQLIASANTFTQTLQPLAAQKASVAVAVANAKKFSVMVNANRDAAELSALIPAYQADGSAALAYLPLLLKSNVLKFTESPVSGSVNLVSQNNNSGAYLRWQSAIRQNQNQTER